MVDDGAVVGVAIGVGRGDGDAREAADRRVPGHPEEGDAADGQDGDERRPGRDEPWNVQHVGDPPRGAPGTPLRRLSDGTEDGIDRTIRQHVVSVGEPVVEDGFDVERVGHAGCPPATARRASASMAARISRWA